MDANTNANKSNKISTKLQLFITITTNLYQYHNQTKPNLTLILTLIPTLIRINIHKTSAHKSKSNKDINFI